MYLPAFLRDVTGIPGLFPLSDRGYVRMMDLQRIIWHIDGLVQIAVTPVR